MKWGYQKIKSEVLKVKIDLTPIVSHHIAVFDKNLPNDDSNKGNSEESKEQGNLCGKLCHSEFS